MSVIAILIIVSLILAGGFLAAFFWWTSARRAPGRTRAIRRSRSEKESAVVPILGRRSCPDHRATVTSRGRAGSESGADELAAPRLLSLLVSCHAFAASLARRLGGDEGEGRSAALLLAASPPVIGMAGPAMPDGEPAFVP